MLILQQAKSNYPNLDGQKIIEKEALPMVNHLERVAFSIAVNHYLYGIYSGSKKFTLEDYSYATNVDKYEEDRVFDKRTWRIYSSDIAHKISREHKSFVLALYKNGNQIEGVVFAEDYKLPKSDATFAKFMESENLLRFTLHDTIPSFRGRITKKFIKDFADETYIDYLSWAGLQSNRLSAMVDANGGIPEELASTIKFYINKEWDMAISAFLDAEKKVQDCIDKLWEINDRARHYEITIDKIRCAEKIRLAINEDLNKLDANFNNEKLVNSIITKLDIVKNLSIPLHFHQVQDRFYLRYKLVINEIYPRWFTRGKALGDDRSLIILINKLAKNFGFNTDKTVV